MKYLKNTGKNAKEAQKSLSSVKHKKINLVLQDFNKLLLKEKKTIIRRGRKMPIVSPMNKWQSPRVAPYKSLHTAHPPLWNP